MRTPLSSLGGPASRDLLEPTFGRGDTGPLESGALDAGGLDPGGLDPAPLLSTSMTKSTSLPSMTRRTSLSLDALGGVFGPPDLRAPLPERFSELGGSFPIGTSSLSSVLRLKLKTSSPAPESPALALASSPSASS